MLLFALYHQLMTWTIVSVILCSDKRWKHLQAMKSHWIISDAMIHCPLEHNNYSNTNNNYNDTLIHWTNIYNRWLQNKVQTKYSEHVKCMKYFFKVRRRGLRGPNEDEEDECCSCAKSWERSSYFTNMTKQFAELNIVMLYQSHVIICCGTFLLM